MVKRKPVGFRLETELQKEQVEPDDPVLRDQSKRARFAKQLARSVFRRNYWDDRLEQGFIAARGRKPKK